ncbi:MAG TPA: M23 family peptidase [Desulfosporosinus sp.]|nr:M23 family peptidase [Desulfosporosinus sp.]
MNRWYKSKSLVLAWVFTFLLLGLVVSIEYRSSASDVSSEGLQGINEPTYKQYKVVTTPLEIKDFPSPVGGKPIRNVGNYYSKNLGNYFFHAGVDYALAEGTVIRATHGGTVIFAGIDPTLGQKVTLDCSEGWLVTYGGLDNLRVREGEVIETQGALGQIGFYPGLVVGENNPTQLHYEVRYHGQVQSPL